MFDQYRNLIPLSDKKWNEYTNCFTRIELPAKTVLLKEGAVAGKVFVVEKGCARAWFNKDGKDLTFQFFFENSVFSSIESFRKRLPSPVSFETIEPSVLWYISKKDIDPIIAEISEVPTLRDKLFYALFERTFEYMNHSLSFIRDSPAERYSNLIAKKPAIVKRVPQHYIASYLGISTVHLSRIKNKLARPK